MGVHGISGKYRRLGTKSGTQSYRLVLAQSRERHETCGALGGHVLVVHGGPTTAVIRGRTGESVVLLSGELPEVLTDAAVDELVDLASALLTEEEVQLFRRCLNAVRQGVTITRRRIEIDGAVLTVYAGDPMRTAVVTAGGRSV
jgi:hypothetical protein